MAEITAGFSNWNNFFKHPSFYFGMEEYSPYPNYTKTRMKINITTRMVWHFLLNGLAFFA
jgi:hypothetical protein